MIPISLKTGSFCNISGFISELSTNIQRVASSVTTSMANSKTHVNIWELNFPLNKNREMSSETHKKLTISAFGILYKNELPINNCINARMNTITFLMREVSLFSRNPYKKVNIIIISNNDVSASISSHATLCIILSTSQDNW